MSRKCMNRKPTSFQQIVKWLEEKLHHAEERSEHSDFWYWSGQIDAYNEAITSIESYLEDECEEVE